MLFELVKNGKVEEVKNVLTYCNRHFRAFNQWEILYDEDFLKIAIRSHDIKMCHVLLEYQVVLEFETDFKTKQPKNIIYLKKFLHI